MKRTFIAATLLIAASVSASATVKPLSWAHRGKKMPPVTSTRVEYHGSAAYSAEGRLYFPPAGRETTVIPSRSKTKTARVK